MKNRVLSLFILLSVVFIASCSNSADNKDCENGDSIKVSEVAMIQIADFDKKASEFVDKNVKIEGTVSHICAHSGKKMFLFTAPNEDIFVKVTSETSFDAALEGSDVSVTGIVKEERITAEEVAQMEKEATAESCSHEGSLEIVNEYKQIMKESGKNYVSFYSIECESFEKKN
jgi:hypothetical protein